MLLLFFQGFCFNVVAVADEVIVFVVIPIWVFVYFSVIVVVVVSLCCYVVKLGKGKNRKQKNTPQKWKYFRAFLQDKLWLHVQKLLFFGLFCCCLPCCSQNTIK